MPRLFSLLMLLCLTFYAHADSYISRTLNKPVPGGVAVVELGPSATAPKATYQGKPVLVVKEQDNWLAIVGIPLTAKPGNERISSGGRSLPFIVGYKKYPEQRITLKNKSQVNPAPAQLKRIEAELAVQIKAYRRFSPNLPSNLVLDKPVNGPLSSKFGVRRFFNGEERNPHSGLDFAVPAGTPIKTPANGKVILVGKDGEKKLEKAVPPDALDLKEFFSTIDQMPMAEKEAAAAPEPQPAAPAPAPAKGAKPAKPGSKPAVQPLDD